MINFETHNELSLKITLECEGLSVHTKVGSMIGMQGEDADKPVKFTKELLGPTNGAGFIGAAFAQGLRRLTGENLPLMKATSNGAAELYLADQGAHVMVLQLEEGESIYVESENLLAFTDDCKYSVSFFGAGVISQGGLAKSKLTGRGENAFVAVTCVGNPIQLEGECVCDPDCFVVSTTKPSVGLDFGLKTLIGQSSGESYNLKFQSSDSVCIIQPYERRSGLSLSMDAGEEAEFNTADTSEAFEGVSNFLSGASRFFNR
ncbi:MAG: hypothetical protein ATN33_00825 [Epulopiscium sp. Nele67-Bin001]|nr:MAG: hypothetical protein ATN33_00825 [Epulopiscium sp. Nele67-Bin001]